MRDDVQKSVYAEDESGKDAANPFIPEWSSYRVVEYLVYINLNTR